ncbi:methyl-accepting chemotaxis protein [Geobacter sp. SVR]|uniref:methyl-accepting chemotaxis protein n=1 Tax=Geobacter sp. SVR TaxID=2495594 RepID=UPI00143F0116|nr:methyl-accepting chemotaxis protein [Geobacter sp. SVR]BCS55679.1 chemotaxis protein [Geobacter sp. SVR]GCF83683.1 chemotaxis protein [Geobacter sp. SVR]
MTSRKDTLSFGKKILILVLASSFGLAAATSGIAMKQFFSAYREFSQSYRKSLFSDFDIQARQQVELAVSMLQRIYERHQKGEMSLEEAKTLGADVIRNLRYGKNGYIWADTTEGVNVAMLGKAVEGTNRLDTQDAKGKYLIREIIKVAQQGGGYTDYWFPRPGGTSALPKRSYSQLFQPFGWVLGTGNYVDDLEALAAKAEEANRKQLWHGLYQILVVMAVLLIGLSALSYFATRRLLLHIGTDPEELAEITRQVAAGDLTMKFEQGKTGIYEAMRLMVLQLRQVMENVNRSSGEVSTASLQLHATSKQMAAGTEEVASQVATVSTAGEEMAATSHDIANNCIAAADTSRNAGELAATGSAIVHQTVEGMNRIAERVKQTARQVEGLGKRSDEIGAIIGTIEDIADQTNLLALNAAIEAARAGEQGRGFAVVADEVRALAERTTRATQEIAGMIKAIQGETRQTVASMEEGVSEVEAGTVEASESGNALQQILDQINNVTGQINQIATAAEQQSSTSREISNNVHQITDIIQQTAKSTQETTEAANVLSRLASDLEEMVRHFKL